MQISYKEMQSLWKSWYHVGRVGGPVVSQFVLGSTASSFSGFIIQANELSVFLLSAAAFFLHFSN